MTTRPVIQKYRMEQHALFAPTLWDYAVTDQEAAN